MLVYVRNAKHTPKKWSIESFIVTINHKHALDISFDLLRDKLSLVINNSFVLNFLEVEITNELERRVEILFQFFFSILG